MASTFAERTQFLEDRVGPGDLTLHVTVDQVYAAFQHFRRELRHPRGGVAYYLEGPLTAELPQLMQRIANGVLDTTEGLPRRTIPVAESIGNLVRTHAPIEYGDLRESAAVTITDNGELSYNRPAAVPRLSATELASKRRGGGVRA